jgi:2-polyprenyl-6-methoxyphenol hydroxylase-like FAD-dependent oxidoreductase
MRLICGRIDLILSFSSRSKLTKKKTSPPGGDGVNVAMHDSLQLAQQIIKFGLGGLDEAVEEYEKLMLPRAVAMIEDSAMMNEAMFAEDAPAPLLKAFEGFGQSAAEKDK